jgi:hypothetical protein
MGPWEWPPSTAEGGAGRGTLWAVVGKGQAFFASADGGDGERLICFACDADVCLVESKLLHRYAALQAVAIAGFFFVPIGGWMHTLWQVGVGWASAAAVVVGIRRFRPEGAGAWYALAAGVFLNASGLLVEKINEHFFHVTTTPQIADLFFISIFPALIIGLGAIVFRRSASEDLGALLLHTAICAFIAAVLAVVAWEFIVWQNDIDHSLTLAKRVMVTAYPLGDLILLALILRLVFAGGARNAAFALVVLSLACFLGADIGWAAFLRSGVVPSPATRHLLEMASMGAYVLVGCAALHPAILRIGQAPLSLEPTERPIRLAALMVSILTAPLVLLAQALLDRWYTLSSF